MKKKYMTMSELMMAVLIVGVLASLSVPIVRSTMDKSKARVCETNLKMLKAAIEIYGLENDVLPASLTQLNTEQFKKAWARVLKEDNPLLIKLAYFVVDLEDIGLAYAQTAFVDRYLSGDTKYLRCPEDKRILSSASALISYGMNEAFRSGEVTFDEYRMAQEDPDGCYFVVGDSESLGVTESAQIARRHSSGKIFTMQGEQKQGLVATVGKKCVSTTCVVSAEENPPQNACKSLEIGKFASVPDTH